jgi:HD-GYP domain-containing protein (c-di-GMP phosphodiesterase class II)
MTENIEHSQLDIDINQLLEVGLLLSSEKDTAKLLEMILEFAKGITRADGGTLYTVTDQKTLKFEIMQNDSLKLKAGGTSGKPIEIPEIPLFNPDGSPVLQRVVTYAYHQNQTINIANSYEDTQFDLTGMKQTDAKLGYKSVSFLTVPMRNHESEIIGVLQLINARSPDLGEILPFSPHLQYVVESLASQAAVALTNRHLINRLEELFESLINMINHAIDDKSPYTGGHCNRVPELTVLMADAVNRCDYGPLKDFHMTEKDRYELKIAGLLHDCGKITTPVHVVDKGTKLETIFDRIHLIDTRFEVLRRDVEIQMLKQEMTQDEYTAALEKLDSDRAFIRHINIGGEFMKDDAVERLKSIGSGYQWVNANQEKVNFLSENELANLGIRAGTLTYDERQIINHHIDVTIDMLNSLTWPKHLKNVPEYAGGHHEKMDGKGYPKGLTRDQMSVQARCMGIADIFEALTARDRPYKKGKTLSESLMILGKMKLDHHVDPDLFNIFLWEKVYETYAHQFLDPSQIDHVDVEKIPGYEAPPVSH